MRPVKLFVLETIWSPDAVWNLTDEALAALRARFPDVHFESAHDRESVDAHLPVADVVLGPWVRERNFALARRLRWIHTPSAGVDHLLFPALVRSDVVMTNTKGVHDAGMAEHVLGVMLMFTRKLHLARDQQLAGRWSQRELATRPPAIQSLAGSTLLVVGYGSIGRAIAAHGRALGQHVLAVRRRAAGDPGPAHEVHDSAALDALLPRADWVVLVLPNTADTRGVLSRERIARLKAGAHVLNVGRGAAIDEPALVDALREGRIAGAGLDVFATEPLPESSPLWSMPQVILTPHTSGFGPRYWERVLEPFARNLEHFLAGRPLESVVDKQAGY